MPLAQNLASMNGKVLRINLDGSIPADNPFPGSPVWSWGHRNAQGLVFRNNVLYSSEHGPNNDDEVNLIYKKRNYGWPNVQGFCDLPGELQFCIDSIVAEPLYAWTPTLATSGMEYYNHPMFPSWPALCLMTTLKDNSLYQLVLNGDGDSITQVVNIGGIDYGRLRDIAIAPDGRIFSVYQQLQCFGRRAPRSIGSSSCMILLPPLFSAFMLTIMPYSRILILQLILDEYRFPRKGMARQQWQYNITNIQGQVFREDRLEYNVLHVGALYPGIYILRLWNAKERNNLLSDL